MKTKRFAALALALTMAMGTFTGCSGNNSSSTADTGDTIRIGAIAPLTGGASDYGITATNGLKLAVEAVSYTHLDVYKRQRLVISARLAPLPPSSSRIEPLPSENR